MYILQRKQNFVNFVLFFSKFLDLLSFSIMPLHLMLNHNRMLILRGFTRVKVRETDILWYFMVVFSVPPFSKCYRMIISASLLCCFYYKNNDIHYVVFWDFWTHCDVVFYHFATWCKHNKMVISLSFGLIEVFLEFFYSTFFSDFWTWDFVWYHSVSFQSMTAVFLNMFPYYKKLDYYTITPRPQHSPRKKFPVLLTLSLWTSLTLLRPALRPQGILWVCVWFVRALA